MLRQAIAKAHGFTVSQIFPRASLSQLMTTVAAAFWGPDDHIALGEPCRPAFTRSVLRVGARYVDIGHDQQWTLQRGALERLLTDGQLRALVLGRPAMPTGTVASLELVTRALASGVLVVVDETDLAYSDPGAGLPRAVSPNSDTALTLVQDSGVDTRGLIVLRRVPGLGTAELVYAVADPETIARLWRLDPDGSIPAPVAAGAWIALDHTAHARRIITEQCAVRSALAAAIADISGYSVASSSGPAVCVGRPGVSGEALRVALGAGGLVVAHSPHHAWRDHVAFGLPTDTVIARVVSAFEHASQAL